MLVTRRSLLATGTLGVGALAIPGFAQAPNVTGARGFTHSVASGEPGPDTLLFWTRYVPVTRDTGAFRDWTVKITLDGLKPGRTYHYRFVAPDGTLSPVGTARTLPDDAARQFKLGLFSCSNLAFGWFNAYGHAAARDDLDLWVHLGDYFYEYGPGHYPLARDAISGRMPPAEPATEIVQLADYRLRYASYRADPDLQALHAKTTMIAQWDDHESANDSWEGAAQNHDRQTQGDWNPRRAAAIQAYREWMPVSDEPWKAYDIGPLATLFRTETRLLARTEQPDVAPLFEAADRQAALVTFRDTAWMDPAATMMGSAQEVWLDHAMRASVKAGRCWQVVGFGTIMGDTKTPLDAATWIAPTAEARARGYIERGIAAAKAGLPFNFDNWGGYPAARARFLKGAMAADANLVVVSGDSHNAWAYDLAQDGRAAGVEFAGHAVTSSGFEGAFTGDPRAIARALISANPELKWCDTARRGYMAMTITADRVSNDWVFVDTVRTRTPRASVGHTATVMRERRVMA